MSDRTTDADALSAELARSRRRRNRALLTLIGGILAAVALFEGFFLLRDSQAPKLVTALFAMVWGGGGMAILYLVANQLAEFAPSEWQKRLIPIVFVAPAIAFVVYFLALPAVRTFIASLYDRDGTNFVGLANYITVFTEPFMLVTFRNNVLWIVFGATFTIISGLLVATLADRSRFESLAKAIIFMPMAISLVGAGVIWKFIYAVRDPSDVQIGLLNAIVVAFGGEPQAWIAQLQPWNNLFLIVIVIWMQTGYAMVLFSAAIKAVPSDILEAARVDGAGEFRIFFSILIPSIMGTIVTVSATVIIFTLKIFDVVLVMTGGQYGTDVIATQFYNQYFTNRNFGLGSAIAIVLLITVIPVMVYNLRQFNKRETL
ncbi:carbohydrate ABC transporter permease [Oryzibacter oryziterrae]|uniref:carbohydrate ABC transporter permease n=1 Tax=Oryzibacter oryziterrae TaxID=2766474 RepID=UPI001F407D7B|nr:sugar ABC transporter permease [Oryzibacter oryziterrae]